MRVKTATPATAAQPASPARLPTWAMVAVLVVVPFLYAALFNLSVRTDENPFDGPDGLTAVTLFALKVLAIAALAVGLHQVANQVERRPSVASVGAHIWATLGIMLVVLVGWAKDRGASLGVDHLWPGQSDPELLGHLRPGPGPGWRPVTIVAAEVVAVLVLSVGVAAWLRLMARRPERLLVTALALAGLFCGLVVYDQIVDWPVMFDFDPFVGDAVLGVLTYELGFFIAPVDPLGAIALATIGMANGLILATAKLLTATD